MTDTSNMPRYVSHKVVHALEVIDVGDYKVSNDARTVTMADTTIREIADKVFSRYVPRPGDFYVVYSNDYESFSPRKEFLEGYTPDGQSFTDIKHGLKIGRPPRSDLAGTNVGDGVALTSAAHPGWSDQEIDRTLPADTRFGSWER